MEVTFTGSARDFREAVWTNNWAHPAGAVKLILLLFLLPILSWSLFVLGIWTGLHARGQLDWADIRVHLPLLFGMLLPPLWRWNLDYCFKKQTNERENLVVITDSGLLCENRGYAKSEIAWAAFTETVEGKKVFLLKLAKLKYIYIPKRVLAPDQQEELRALIAAHVPAK